ncbi:protein-(glutamine-N5) methyltransferase, release factor-specific [Lysinibacillus sp. KCTC 33748]|uniref:peptide chain release factor N(5)-glutamine methyltransferase n=1 Tax=unclassified Lysinibacillus TaxID=2636778 RepID=UPI0009A80E9C|nr:MULTISPECIES: peptide chain release factor N(5)-glutamine methyltransferase [unclassified Lysinibacillus]OXS76934.1 protein-(glutamine-N5) methyltransferase, release factor-specific [Lysinibacillus sp. KCTC 33748]SKB27914.1 release factor glutamine methyltransferase [Lysinibacillus sp. AC-3]
MMTYNNVMEALQWASSFLVDNGREETAARIVMQHILGTSYSEVMLHLQDALTAEQQEKFKELIEEHASGRPVQYCIGSEEFYGRSFIVDESVLIPRPETEELVLGTINRMNKIFKNQNLKLADIGTGSGAIALSMKLECPELTVVATDLSEAALSTAQKNAQRLAADIDFRLGDLTKPLSGEKFDIVLSNPPYIAFDEAKEMSNTVLEHEPHSALFAEEDGLILYRKLAEQLPPLMKKPALIGLEIGYTQGEQVAQFFKNSFPQATVSIEKDINGKPRMIFCEIHV